MENTTNTPSSYEFPISEDILECLAEYGKLLIGSFLKELMEDYEEGDKGIMPSPKSIGATICEELYREDEFSYETQKEIEQEAKAFINKQTPAHKKAIAAYLFAQSDYLDYLRTEVEEDWNNKPFTLFENTTEDEWIELKIKEIISKNIQKCDEKEIVKWLIHVAKEIEDILDYNQYWGPEKAAYANENFQNYLGMSPSDFMVFSSLISDYEYFAFKMNEESELGEGIEELKNNFTLISEKIKETNDLHETIAQNIEYLENTISEFLRFRKQ